MANKFFNPDGVRTVNALSTLDFDRVKEIQLMNTFFLFPYQPWKRNETLLLNFLEFVMGSDAPHCYVWLGTMQKMANAAKCKFM